MGMDVYGKDPTAEVGKYFRNNVWWWHPLWSMCTEMAPEITEPVTMGHSNDGDGLGAIDSVRLADELTRRLENGDVDLYITQRQEWLDSLPLEDCKYCDATGTRHDGLTIGRETSDFRCNVCQGNGQVENWQLSYQLDRENVEKFRDFLTYCGGFEIC